jgi:hypothetical protein
VLADLARLVARNHAPAARFDDKVAPADAGSNNSLSLSLSLSLSVSLSLSLSRVVDVMLLGDANEGDEDALHSQLHQEVTRSIQKVYKSYFSLSPLTQQQQQQQQQ